MAILTVVHRNRHSAALLSVVLFAWLSVLVTPCAMAFLPGTPSSEKTSVIGVHHDGCQNSKQMANSDCCCDLDIIVSGDAPQQAKLVTLIALPIILDLFNPTLSNKVSADLQKPPLHETSPPVYLTTQRLRI